MIKMLFGCHGSMADSWELAVLVGKITVFETVLL